MKRLSRALLSSTRGPLVFDGVSNCVAIYNRRAFDNRQ